MPDSLDEKKDTVRRTASEHIVSKHDAFTSEAVQSLVKNTLIVGGSKGDTRLLISLLRAALGRHVDAALAIGADEALRAYASARPELVLVRDNPDRAMNAAETIERLRAAGATAPVIVIHGALSARDAVVLRRLGVLDAIDADDLDSVRLFEALLKAVPQKKPTPFKLASLLLA